VLERSFKDLLKGADVSLGGLAVIYDKNPMEASGYAAVMAEICKETVYLVEYYDSDVNPPVRWVDKVMEIRTPEGAWVPIRAAFRYVTQRPWQRIPIQSRTLVLNSVRSSRHADEIAF